MELLRDAFAPPSPTRTNSAETLYPFSSFVAASARIRFRLSHGGIHVGIFPALLQLRFRF